METKNIISQKDTMRTYYQFQSTIYDATRWLFLFGRNEILELIQSKVQPKHIVEVGCGTGYNTKKLGKLFPNSEITGIDVSSDMLAIAKKKVDQYNHVTLLERPYGAGALCADFHRRCEKRSQQPNRKPPYPCGVDLW